MERRDRRQMWALQKTLETFALTRFANDAARLWSNLARPGWSGPSAFSLIAIARAYSASASAYLPYKGSGQRSRVMHLSQGSIKMCGGTSFYSRTSVSDEKSVVSYLTSAC